MRSWPRPPSRCPAAVVSRRHVGADLRRVLPAARPRGWHTSGRDVGRYRGKGEGLPVELKVAKRGRSVRDFKAQVSTFCPGLTVDQNRILIGVAPFERAKVAPDGRFYSITRPASDTVVEAYGRIRNGRVRRTVRPTIGGCDGIAADYSVRLRR